MLFVFSCSSVHLGSFGRLQYSTELCFFLGFRTFPYIWQVQIQRIRAHFAMLQEQRKIVPFVDVVLLSFKKGKAAGTESMASPKSY